jgi:hypothetical protein
MFFDWEGAALASSFHAPPLPIFASEARGVGHEAQRSTIQSSPAILLLKLSCAPAYMVFPANSSSGGSARELEDDVEMEGAAMEILSILKGVGGDPYGLKRADPYLRNANPITRDRAFAADRGGNDVLVSELCTATAPVQNGLHGGACVFERMGAVPVLEEVVDSR